MRDRISTVVPVVMMALLAALTYWLSRVMHDDNPRGPQRHDPDYIVEHLTMRQFDATGAVQHTLVADHMAHFPDDDSTLVANPHLTFHRKPESEILAATALLNRDGKQVNLAGKVRVIRHVAGDTDTVMTTQSLVVYPDDEHAHTDDPVTFTKGPSVVHGSGLDIDNKSGISILKGRVSGVLHRTPK